MFARWNLKDNSLHRKVFAFFDIDNSMELNFGEYALSLWNFLTMKNLGLAVFLMADPEGKGSLSYSTTKRIFEEVHSIGDLEKSPLYHVYAKMKNDAMEVDTIILDSFVDACLNNPSMTNPLFVLQTKLRENVLSPLFWVDMKSNRFKYVLNLVIILVVDYYFILSG